MTELGNELGAMKKVFPNKNHELVVEELNFCKQLASNEPSTKQFFGSNDAGHKISIKTKNKYLDVENETVHNTDILLQNLSTLELGEHTQYDTIWSIRNG
uniref:Uncharacterized protein n=1 Tax=Strigamia maritima TaxID=126957 RepID=T1IWG8_STRMM